MRRSHPFRLGLPVAAVALALDQASKTAALTWLMDPPRVMPVTPFLNFVLSFNTGVTFGLGRELGVEGAWLLAAVAVAVVALLMRWLARSDGWVETVAIGLVIGGALGNVVDRLRQGAVTDWLDLHYAGWHWPTFNLADVAIVSGVTLLLFAPLLQRRSVQNPGTSHGSV